MPVVAKYFCQFFLATNGALVRREQRNAREVFSKFFHLPTLLQEAVGNGDDVSALDEFIPVIKCPKHVFAKVVRHAPHRFDHV